MYKYIYKLFEMVAFNNNVFVWKFKSKENILLEKHDGLY